MRLLPSVKTTKGFLASILVGYSDKITDAIYTNPCNTQLSTNYLSSFSLSCAPSVKLCIYNVVDNYVTINIPILNIDLSANKNIFINFIVSVNDIINNNIVQTTLNSEIPIISSGITNWCLVQSSQIDITSFLESINLIIGIADNINDYNNLKTYNNIQTNTSIIDSINSKSIESGLLTFIIKGKDSYFNLVGNSDYSLDLHDVITLHITDINKYNEVMALFSNTMPFNIINVNNYPTLDPTANLLQICSTNANPFPQSSCVLKQDIKSTVLSSTSYQLNNNVDKTSFIQSIFNKNDNYIYNLGTNYSSLITDKYDLSDITKKYRKAFWINPGFDWTGAGINQQNRFILSQWIIVISLINVNQNSTSSRRRLLSINTNTVNNKIGINYGNTPENIIASNLNIDLELISTWDLKMTLTIIQACYEKQKLINDVQSILSKYISECASPYLQLGIVSITFDNNNLNCSNTRRLLSSDIISSIRFILAFENTNNIFFDLQKFTNEPNIESIQSVNIIPSIIKLSYNSSIIDKSIINNQNYANNDNKNLYVTIAVPVVLGSLLLIAIILYCRYKIKKIKEEREFNNNGRFIVQDLQCSTVYTDNDAIKWDENNLPTAWIVKQ